VRAWAEADPGAALIAVQSMLIKTSPEVGRIAEVALVRGWFESGQPGLEQYIYDLGMGVQRQRALYAYALAAVRKQGPDAVMRWAESVPAEDKTYKLAVYRQVATALGVFDRDAALRWCDAQCDGPYGNNMRRMIATLWLYGGGESEPLEWLSQAPEGKDKQDSLRGIFATWGVFDREAALAWMASKTAGDPEPWIRSLYANYAGLLAEDSGADAIEWAERVEDEREREVALIVVARIWREQDEAAAEAWLQGSSLTEEAREKARQKRKTMPGLPGLPR
jgi:hypothetical protein